MVNILLGFRLDDKFAPVAYSDLFYECARFGAGREVALLRNEQTRSEKSSVCCRLNANVWKKSVGGFTDLVVLDSVAVPRFTSRVAERCFGVVEPSEVLGTGIDQQAFAGFVVVADQWNCRWELPSPLWGCCERVFESPNELFFHACSQKRGASALTARPTPPQGTTEQ